MKKNLIVLSSVIVILVISGIYFLRTDETPVPEEISDSGLTREETEKLMREIGYVQ